MSITAVEEISGPGFPELSWLGERLEMLRIERRLSKQELARKAGTSRQQLWRVMTGKSELTTSLCHRLAEVLQIDPRLLREESHLSRDIRLYTSSPAADPGATPPSLERYLASSALVLRTLESMPDGAPGHELKREFMNCLEEIAQREGIKVSQEFFELRRRLVNGEL